MRFANPLFLILLGIIPLLVWDYFRHGKLREVGIVFSDISIPKNIRPGFRVKYRHGPMILRMAAIFIFILAIARPQAGQKEEEIITEGIDIMLTLDISGSMKAEDFAPQNRLAAAKDVLTEFIKSRHNDKIGLVVFSRYSFTQCPLTLDYGALLELLDKIDIGMIEDGTAIGMAISNAVNRLRDSEVKSRIIILLTDGVNNAGKIDPLTAAKAAKALGMRIYTVGAGKPGGAMYPIEDPIFGKRYVHMDTEIDEELLKNIADETGGLYFRAKDKDGLREIYKTIGQLEKTRIETKEYANYTELAVFFILPGFILLLFEITLANTLFRKIP
ncbi:MAG: aerotolerance regulator BatA [Candidatus Omnitrophica bacterium CG02_land_8_20_14_3_00__42_8]|nr:MAG: aerotolerance regulator BatA [Candidatus Omnitrophica bacterium CG02_land_8_20_14_3_00__42_8]PIW67919.1 MAG: aerotolerance regulator BatA [Candidatus Omnitrophica bacterium CG12_big_fil_rev_8_21_14_0_65_42_8]